MDGLQNVGVAGLRMGARGVGTAISTLARLSAAACALLLMGATPGPDASGYDISKVRFGGDQSTTRVVIELARSTHGKLVRDGSSGRLDLALSGLDGGAGLGGTGQGLVRVWAVDDSTGSATLKLDLTRPVQVSRRFILPPSDGSPNYRYVMDLIASGPPIATPAPGKAVTVALRSRKVVVIDAGHGGKDPGALGEDVQEKSVTLPAALALKARLERDGRYKVVLTRSDDTFVPLTGRVQIARRADADLFISLHADAGGDPSLRGATVYTLSDKGSERAAQNLMRNDNWFINVSLPGRDRAVNQILLDLTQRATKNQSTAFADMLVGRVSEQAPLLQRGHRDAGYVVLLAPDVPAVLLEMGFITNLDDEAALRNSARRARLMSAVGDAIDDYFAAQRRYAAR